MRETIFWGGIMITTLIYDYDGTLMDSLPTVVHGTNVVLHKYGVLPQTPAQIVEQMRWPTAQRMGMAAGINDGDTSEQMATEFYQTIDLMVENEPGLFRPYAGVTPLLREMNSLKFRQCILSNNKGSLIRKVIHHLGLGPYFETITGEEDMPAPKPDPRGLTKAASPGTTESVYIGDSPVDALTAKNAGMRSIGVTWGIHSRKELETNCIPTFDLLVDSPTEILAVIRDWEK